MENALKQKCPNITRLKEGGKEKTEMHQKYSSVKSNEKLTIKLMLYPD